MLFSSALYWSFIPLSIITLSIADFKHFLLIPGDIIDEDIIPVIHSNVGEKLTSFKSKYGVYAVTGNHEYIGGVYKAKKYLTGHNINLLNDTAILIDDSFYLAGREDLTNSAIRKGKN